MKNLFMFSALLLLIVVSSCGGNSAGQSPFDDSLQSTNSVTIRRGAEKFVVTDAAQVREITEYFAQGHLYIGRQKTKPSNEEFSYMLKFGKDDQLMTLSFWKTENKEEVPAFFSNSNTLGTILVKPDVLQFVDQQVAKIRN